jgi:hypothetical protein
MRTMKRFDNVYNDIPNNDCAQLIRSTPPAKYEYCTIQCRTNKFIHIYICNDHLLNNVSDKLIDQC